MDIELVALIHRARSSLCCPALSFWMPIMPITSRVQEVTADCKIRQILWRRVSESSPKPFRYACITIPSRVGLPRFKKYRGSAAAEADTVAQNCCSPSCLKKLIISRLLYNKANIHVLVTRSEKLKSTEFKMRCWSTHEDVFPHF